MIGFDLYNAAAISLVIQCNGGAEKKVEVFQCDWSFQTGQARPWSFGHKKREDKYHFIHCRAKLILNITKQTIYTFISV